MRRPVDNRGRRAGGGGGGGEPTYQVSSFTDADFYQGAAGAYAPGVHSFSLCYRLASLPGAGRRCIISRLDGATAEYEFTLGISTHNQFSVVRYTGTAPNYVEVASITHVAADVGKLFLAHVAIYAGAGAQIQTYDAGVYYWSGTCPGVPNVGGADIHTTIGRYEAAPNFSGGSFCEVICFRESTAILTPEQIADDAASVMSRDRNLMFPTLPGEVGRWIARDLVRAPALWADRSGSDVLTRTGAPVVGALAASTWSKNAGRILHTGDSTGAGQVGVTGGWRPGVTAALTAAGWRHTIVGSIANSGLSYCIGATSLSDFLDGGAFPLSVEVTAQAPFIVVISQVYNDWRLGDGAGGAVSQATVRARMDALLDDIYAASPVLRVVIPQCLAVQAGDPAAWPAADLAACNAAIAEWNTVTVPAIVAAQNAAGRFLIAAAAYASDPVRSDAVHPVDGATGYDLMYPPIVAAIEAIKP